ncbi:MAG: flagellar hook-associated protein FlgL [Salinisphaeraceae bacterium]|nr:flagellar hook-associated protein FlgL [Salinisphaeraceae bacterium]
MRISTSALFRQAVDLMNQQQISLAKIQEQIATGQRMATAADDPAAHAQALNLEASLDNINRMGDNASLASQNLAVVEDTLGEINNNLQRVRELALQANSGTLDATQRGHIKVEIDQVLDNILQLANRQGSDGSYLFAGNDQANAPPFSRSGSAFNYSGDQGQRQLEVAPGQYITQNLNGADVFQRISTGNGEYRVRENAGASGSAVLRSSSLVDPNLWDGGPYQLNFTSSGNYEVRDAGNALIGSGTYQPGDSIDVQGVRVTLDGTPASGDSFTVETAPRQDIFSTVQQLSDALADPEGGARLSNSIYATLEDIDQSINHINDQRALVGSRMNTADAALQSHDALSLFYQSSLSEIKDLDYAAASAELAQQLTALQAAQAAFVRVQGMSLFDMLR